jgi:LysR family positive regulator for ilvC
LKIFDWKSCERAIAVLLDLERLERSHYGARPALRTMHCLHRVVADFAMPLEPRRGPVDWDDLRIFLHLSRSLHFGRTAGEVHKSASAVSRVVQRLEEELGRALFERDNRRVELTAAGEALARYAGDALAHWDEFKDGLRQGGAGLRGSISVFASVTACQSFLPRLLMRFREAHPEVQLRLDTGYAVDALQKLAQGEVDVTVAALPERVPRQLVSRVVEITPLIFVSPAAPSEVSRRVDKRTIDWSEVPMVLPAQGLARSAVERWFRARKVRPRVYSEVMGNEAILALVSTGCGVGVVPKLVLDKSPLSPEVRALDVEPHVGEFRVGLCAARRALVNPVISAFWNALR